MSNAFKNLTKKMGKMKGVSTDSSPPSFWITLGNYCINKVMSGRFNGGIGQGRLFMVAGPSSAGKSFVMGNIAKAALDQGYGVFVVDSENALDDDFMQKIGVDVDAEHYMYSSLNTIDNCISVVADFISEYRSLSASDPDFPPYLILIDSLDMLITGTEEKNFDKGIIKGDQGQQAKQLKKMLTQFMHGIKGTNLAMACSKQVYQEQDPIKALRNPWKITEALRFAFTQILLVTKLQLKDDKTKKFEGIKLKAYGEKTRYTKPFQQCEIEVPYDVGLDPYNGLLSAAVAMGLIEQNGSWYVYNGDKFQQSKFPQYQEQVLADLIKIEDQILNVEIQEEEDMENIESQSQKNKTRKKKGKDE